jgi:hypothetical protein
MRYETPNWKKRQDAWAEVDRLEAEERRLRDDLLRVIIVKNRAREAAEELGPRPMTEPVGILDFINMEEEK